MTVSFITGANRGIGLEIVRQLIQRDGHVYAGVRTPTDADVLQQLAQKFPGKLSIIPLEMRDERQIKAAVAQIKEKSGSLNLLINNAGIYTRGESVGSLNTEAMLEGLQNNSVAPILLAQACLEILKEGKPSVVINMSSGMGSISRAGSGSPTYRAGKAALNMYSRVLANELHKDGVIVVAMHPGWVQTDMGGSGAQLTVEESVKGQLKVIDQLTISESGRFLQWDGSEVAW